MDTKLRNYSHSILIKVLLFIVVVASVSYLITGIIMDDLKTDHGIFSVLNNENFYTSRVLGRYLEKDISLLRNTVELKKKLSKAKQGSFLTEDRMYSKSIEDFSITTKEEFQSLSTESYESLKEDLIKADVYEINRQISQMDEPKYITYYLKSGALELSNASDVKKRSFTQSKIYILSDLKKFDLSPEILNKSDHWFKYPLSKLLDEVDVLYLSFSDEILETIEKDYKQTAIIAENRLRVTFIYLMIAFIALLMLLTIIGRTYEDDGIKMNFMDRLYTDTNVIILSVISTVYVLILFELLNMGLDEFYYLLAFSSLAITLILILTLSLVKHIKNRSIVTHSIIFIILRKIFRTIKDLLTTGSLSFQMFLWVAIYTIAVILSVLMYPLTFFILPVLVLSVLWFVNIKGINQLRIGLEKIKRGDLSHKIEIGRNRLLIDIAKKINTIGDGLKNAIENEMKNEKFKTELVTNVSHDLRTPLTSIITYVDLLKDEKNPIKREKYLRVIDKKSHRLKLITDDLFDMAKLNSGQINVEKEEIDILSLINQGLAEYENQIENKGLDIRVYSKSDEKTFITADGKLTWRAMNNLLSNVVKYAMKDSRVYIDIDYKEDFLEIEMKNISAYELNISAEELLERFTRGDESRNSEGSGLGLSIAKNLIEVQRGTFDIAIDGDLFKVTLAFKLEKE